MTPHVLRGRSWLGVLCAWGCLSGCLSPPADAVARLSRTRAEAAAQLEALDRLEERLLGTQANVKLWQELQRRHEEVTAIACQNQGTHYGQMVEYLAAQESKGRLLRHRRFASANLTTPGVKQHRAHD